MAKGPHGGVLVAIRMHDGNNAGYSETRGVIDAELLRQVLAGERTNGWFAIEDCHWEQGGQTVRQSVAGRTWGYGDTTYVRLENVLRIIPLAEGLPAKQRMKTSKGSPRKPSRP